MERNQPVDEKKDLGDADHATGSSMYKRFAIFGAATIVIISLITTFWVLEGSMYTKTSEGSLFTQHLSSANTNAPEKSLKPEGHTNTYPDTVVMYAYHEEATGNALRNVNFFIDHALHGSADFIFILQGDSPGFNKLEADKDRPNVKIIQRKNTCMDLGAYGEILRRDPSLLKRYKKFVFVNASVRGPFLPSYSQKCWTTAFTEHLDHTTKLVSMSGHCMYNLFQTQSMVFATDDQGLAAMLENGTLNCTNRHRKAIKHEINMARLLLEDNGWKSWTLLTGPHADIKYDPPCVTDDSTFDPWHQNTYFGFNVHPYETIFMKANRNEIDGKVLEKYTEWHDRMKYSSYDYC